MPYVDGGELILSGLPQPQADPNLEPNFCHHLPIPRIDGCPMTFPGGYCDPNGDLQYWDADYHLGYYMYQENCVPGNGCPNGQKSFRRFDGS